MAINDPTAIKFSNERVRTAADVSAQGYYRAKSLIDQWTAQGLDVVIPNDATVMPDGADTDGRPVITGADIHGMVAILKSYVAMVEANSSAALTQILKVAVHPQAQ